MVGLLVWRKALADSEGHVAGTMHMKACRDNNIFLFFFSGAMFFVEISIGLSGCSDNYF